MSNSRLSWGEVKKEIGSFPFVPFGLSFVETWEGKVEGKDSCLFFLSLFLKDFIYLFSERGEGRDKEKKRKSTLPTGDLACNPGMCPDWEANQ